MHLIPDDPGIDGRGGRPAAAIESPSLFAAGADGPPAYELKFLLGEDQAAEVEGRVAGPLGLDTHADPALGKAYLTTSVYTDTPAFDVYFRNTPFGRRKYRVRRYGPSGPVFVERKSKRGDRVRKRRSEVGHTDIAHLTGPESSPEWAGHWFHRQLTARLLRPVCRMSYERVAYTGAADGGTVRVTFDRRVRGVVAGGWELEPVGPVPVLLAGQVICEFKFRLALPGLFKGVIGDLGLTPSTVSKYRLFMRTAGGLPAGGGTDA